MANVKITDMTTGAPVDGTEVLATSKAAAPRKITVDEVITYVLAQIAAIAAGTVVATADKLYLLDDTDSTAKPVALETVLQHGIDLMWGKAAEASPDDADVLLLKDGGATEKTVTAAVFAEYVRATVEAAILELSSLTDGSSGLATGDLMLITQGGVGKKITVDNLKTLIYATLAAHVTGLTGTVTAAGTDELYFVRGGTGDKMTLAELGVYIATQVTLSGSGTTDQLADWADANTLRAGPTVTKSVAGGGSGFGAGSEVAIPTSAAVRAELDEVVRDYSDIGAALVAADEVLVYDDSASAQKRATMTRLKTFVGASTQYKTLWVPFERMNPSQTAGATIIDSIESAVQKITQGVASFAGTVADESVEWDQLMPLDWDLGTLKFKVYWTNGHADADAADYILFTLAAGALSDSDAIDAALGTGKTVEDQHITDGDLHVSPASDALTVGGTPALGDMVHFKLTRDYDYAGAGAAMDVDCYVHGVLIQYVGNATTVAW